MDLVYVSAWLALVLLSVGVSTKQDLLEQIKSVEQLLEGIENDADVEGLPELQPSQAVRNIDKEIKDDPNDNILEVDLQRSLELLAKASNRGNAILKTLGEHPEEKKNITVHNGKFGPYVKCGKINASIMSNSTPDTVTLNEAIDLINTRKIKMGIKKTKKTKSK